MSSEEIAEDDDDEDDEGLDKKDKENALLKEGMYRIIGTLSNPSSVPPDYLCECIQVFLYCYVYFKIKFVE